MADKAKGATLKTKSHASFASKKEKCLSINR